MRIKGFQGTSLLDFPGKVSSLVYTGGCNLTCSFCHNPGLVQDPDQYPDFPLEDFFEELRRRRSFIDGVVVSGGEPTLVAGLVEFLEKIKELGLQVKLDSNGMLPQVLTVLLDRGLIDYLALDLKTSPHRYTELCSKPLDPAALLASCRLTMERAPEYEFRTTCVPGLVSEADLCAMGEVIRGARLWVLQQYLPREKMLGDAPAFAYPRTKFECLKKIAAPYAEEITGRGW